MVATVADVADLVDAADVAVRSNPREQTPTPAPRFHRPSFDLEIDQRRDSCLLACIAFERAVLAALSPPEPAPILPSVWSTATIRLVLFRRVTGDFAHHSRTATKRGATPNHSTHTTTLRDTQFIESDVAARYVPASFHAGRWWGAPPHYCGDNRPDRYLKDDN